VDDAASSEEAILLRFHATLLLLLTVTGLSLIALVAAPPGNPTYSLGISPSNPIGLGGTVALTVSETGGTKNSAYTLAFRVQKPNGTGVAVNSQVLSTDNFGAGGVSVQYPASSWTALNGTVKTDVVGVYNVVVNQTAPTNTGTVASGQFTVTSQLSIVISQPTSGAIVQRGQTVTISVTVSNSLGAVSGAIVVADYPTDTPTNGHLPVPQVTSTNGVYSTIYQVAMNDPLGYWTIIVTAKDGSGNFGTSLPVVVTLSKSSLFVDAMITYNSKGVPSTSFSAGDVLYPYFRIRYSGSSGAFLTAGQYVVSVKNPSGVTAANLTTVYDANRLGFYAPTGYSISGFDPGGTWTVVINPNSLDDGFGNTGPSFATSVRVDIVTITSPLNYLPFVIGGVVAILGGIVAMKRYDTSLEGFEHLEQMIGGPIPRGSSLLLLGDPGSGKTVLSYELLHDELEAGRVCALLSYDAFPEDVQGRMGEFGWDIISHLRKGRLKIIDCYSGLAGQGEGALRDPSDLTELNIQVTSFITKSKSAPVTLILDSLTPIFNGVEPKQAINFLQTVGAKVKKTGGLFILTATKGAIPEDAIAKIKSIVDGVVELTLVRTGRKGVRYLSVLKMERRRIASETVSFEIERGRGLVFRVSRFRIFGRKLKHLKLPSSPFTKAEPVASTGGRAAEKKGDENNGEGKSSGVSPKRSGARER
jgi:KaiC/GvpD/RAD55 family RecA-like ATPase